MSLHPTTIHLPSLRCLARHALPRLVESTLMPLALFWLLFDNIGLDAGIWAAFGWSVVAIVARLTRRRPVPAVLALGALLLGARTAIGLWSGSAVLYFLQPTVTNFVFAIALVLTLGLKRPLLAKLADDFCAFPDALTAHPGVQRFFRKVSLLWATVFLVNGATTLAVLATRTVSDYLLVSTAGSYSVVALGIGASLWWFRRALAGHGIRLRIGPAAMMPAVPVP